MRGHVIVIGAGKFGSYLASSLSARGQDVILIDKDKDAFSNITDEFAGCIIASPLLQNQEKIVMITSLFVPEQFRGLGISTELINMCISSLRNCGKEWVIIPNTIAPDILQPLLTRTGFRKINSGYILSLIGE